MFSLLGCDREAFDLGWVDAQQQRVGRYVHVYYLLGVAAAGWIGCVLFAVPLGCTPFVRMCVFGWCRAAGQKELRVCVAKASVSVRGQAWVGLWQQRGRRSVQCVFVHPPSAVAAALWVFGVPCPVHAKLSGCALHLLPRSVCV
jgi:hypothetical protein